MRKLVPVIDLFSGPGGLAEGFAAPTRKNGRSRYRIALSIENDVAAHRTLRLRAFLRKFQSRPPDEYYAYLNGTVSDEPDWAKLNRKKWKEACDETPLVELGTDVAASLLRKRIRAIRKEHGNRTVLLGGPPCQAYSVAGRARNAGNPDYKLEEDPRLSLYKEYAKALKLLQPIVAVMENVKGILSARYNDEPVFDDVMDALQNAGGKGRYRLFTLSPTTGTRSWADGLDPKDFLVRTEEHGVPQRRHRVFVICIRKDVASVLPEMMFPKLEPQESRITVSDVVGEMSPLRSRLSRGDDARSWQVTVENASRLIDRHLPTMSEGQAKLFRCALKLALMSARGTSLPYRDDATIGAAGCKESCPEALRDWLCDENLTRLPNNETRSHIQADIYDRWGARLLEQNVRVFLQARGKVNRGIRLTLENEPWMFFAYNNGITATAEAVEISNAGGQMLLRRLTNFQIVNGGQTTASIHLARLRDVDLSRTFAQMKLSVVSPERATALVPKISEYANSQNRVNAADFFANHPFHILMEGFSRRIYAPSPDGRFRQSKWFYERARGQYADARAYLTVSERKKFDLARMLHELPNFREHEPLRHVS